MPPNYKDNSEHPGFQHSSSTSARVQLHPNPDFSPGTYCEGGEAHVYFVALEKRARHTASMPVRVFLHAPCIHGLLLLLVTIPGEKSGLKPKARSPAFRFQLSSYSAFTNLQLSLAADPAPRGALSIYFCGTCRTEMNDCGQLCSEPRASSLSSYPFHFTETAFWGYISTVYVVSSHQAAIVSAITL